MDKIYPDKSKYPGSRTTLLSRKNEIIIVKITHNVCGADGIWSMKCRCCVYLSVYFAKNNVHKEYGRKWAKKGGDSKLEILHACVGCRCSELVWPNWSIAKPIFFSPPSHVFIIIIIQKYYCWYNFVRILMIVIL